MTRRRLDYLFLPFFAIGILYGWLISLPEALGVPVSADSPWPPLRSLHHWAVTQEPQHLHHPIPPTLEASVLYDGFVQVPVLIVLLVGIWRLKPWPWLPTLGIMYGVSAVVNMYFYFMQTFLGPHPPPHLATYVPANIAWLIVPALLVWRCWPAQVGRAVA